METQIPGIQVRSPLLKDDHQQGETLEQKLNKFFILVGYAQAVDEVLNDLGYPALNSKEDYGRSALLQYPFTKPCID